METQNEKESTHGHASHLQPETDQLEVTEVTEAEQELASLKSKYDRAVRALAECENARKQVEKDAQERIRYALFSFAAKLAPAFDPLDRAISSVAHHTIKDPLFDALLEGVRMTISGFHTVFNSFGIEKVEALGKKFDPNYHEIIGAKDNSDVDCDTVIEVLQHGYTLHGRLVRPSLVIVSKNI